MTATIIRVLFYVLSGILALGGAWLADWGVAYDAGQGVLSIDVETAMTTLGAAVVASLAVFKRWGKW